MDNIARYILKYINKNNELKTINLQGNIIAERIYNGRTIYSIRRFSEVMPEPISEQHPCIFEVIDLTDFTKDCTDITLIVINPDGREEFLLSAKRITNLLCSCQTRPEGMGRNNCFEECGFVEEIRMW